MTDLPHVTVERIELPHVENDILRHDFFHQGLRLSYLDNHCPSAEIPVVMLHGFTASAKINWLDSAWITALTQAGRRVIALDARGHGQSDKPYNSDYYPSNVMIEDSIHLMTVLGFSQADFVGYSMGARMAAFAAIKYPEKVGKLLLGGMGINLKKGLGNPEPIAKALLAENLNHVRHRPARRFRRLAELGNNDLTALAYCILSSRQQISEQDLANIRAKTLIIVGDEDDTGGNPHELVPYIANSQALQIADCNHFNALTHAEFRNVGINFIL